MAGDTYPVQGGSGVQPNYQQPTLVPNFDQGVASGGGTVDWQSPYAFLQANPRVDATLTATIGGSATTSDEVTIVIANGVFGNSRYGSLSPAEIYHTYTVVGGDTVTTIAEALADLFNDDVNAQQAQLRADVAGAVITFHWNGPIGNLAVGSSPLDEPAQITIGGSATASDTLNALFTGPAYGNGVIVTQAVTGGWTTTQMATALAAAITANATLTALGVSGAGSTSHVNLTVPATAEPVNIVVFANPAASTATITGTATLNDVLNLVIHNTNLPGGAITSSYTVQTADTVTIMAAGIAAAVNANQPLIAAGITATAALGVVTIHYPAAVGAMTYTESVTGGGTETITLSAAPTETISIATSGSETVTFGNSGKFASGSGPIIPFNNFQYSLGGTVANFRAGQPTFTDPVELAKLVSDGMPIV